MIVLLEYITFCNSTSRGQYIWVALSSTGTWVNICCKEVYHYSGASIKRGSAVCTSHYFDFSTCALRLQNVSHSMWLVVYVRMMGACYGFISQRCLAGSSWYKLIKGSSTVLCCYLLSFITFRTHKGTSSQKRCWCFHCHTHEKLAH